MLHLFGTEQKVDREPQYCTAGGNDAIADKHKERNREHAKRTRQRKKELTEAMKLRLQDLQREVVTITHIVGTALTYSPYSGC